MSKADHGHDAAPHRHAPGEGMAEHHGGPGGGSEESGGHDGGAREGSAPEESGHDHGGAEDHAGHDHGALGLVERGAERGRLKWVLVLTGAFLVAEIVGGVVADSLALLADAGHMFTDAGSLGLALVAMHFAQRPPSSEKTYGWVRFEILAALANGATLLVISFFIVWEAWRRLHDPVQVDGPIMLGVAGVGLGVNLAGAYLLHGHAGENLNMRGAYLHVVGDLLGSVGAIAAGVIILTTGWTLADPIASVVIAGLILVSAWRLVREAVDVLLEAAPSHVNVDGVLESLRDVEHLHDVHDLHVWTLTSGFVALSGHGVIDEPHHMRPVLDAIRERARERGIDHVTFQLEPRELVQIEGGRAEG